MTVTLTVGGRRYGGWTRVEVSRALDRMAADFTLGATDRWPGQDAPWRIRPGDACAVALDGETVVAGWVDDVAIAYDGERHDVTVRGRSRTGDLVDCGIVTPPSQWVGRNMAQIAADLCRPFGIAVVVQADVPPPKRDFTVDQGETVYEALESLGRQYAVICTDDEVGRLVLTQARRGGRAGTALAHGPDGNIISASALFSHRDRFSAVIVKGQQKADDAIPGIVAASVEGRAADAGVGRYRPLVVVWPGALDGNARAAEAARHEAAVRFGKAARVAYRVAEWRGADGALWRVNTVVRVRDDRLELDRDMLIAAVTFTLDEQAGRVADIEVVRPEAFDRVALEPRGGDQWEDVRQAIRTAQ